MSIRDAALLEEHQIALTGLPLRCSACFNQDPGKRHIDMDAACDRGYGADEAVKVAYDDLVLCEDCVAQAARIIGYSPTAEQQDLVDSLETRLDRTEKELVQQRKYSDTLEDLFDKRKDKIKIDHRVKPRPLRTVNDA